MDISKMLSAIDSEIAQLQRARAAIVGIYDTPTKRRGRPKGSINKTAVTLKVKAKRSMSVEGRARIVAAQNARWAAKKAPSNKPAGANYKRSKATINKVTAKTQA